MTVAVHWPSCSPPSLWPRCSTLRAEGLPLSVRRYAAITLPIAGPALGAAAGMLALERLVAG
jgi:hypothetical protein